MVSKIVSAVLIVATLGLSGAAMATPNVGVQQDVGFITAVDVADKTVTLSSGVTYQLPGGFDIKSFNEGQKVAVSYDQIGGSLLATTIVFSN
jgi:hypothetical protein